MLILLQEIKNGVDQGSKEHGKNHPPTHRVNAEAIFKQQTYRCAKSHPMPEAGRALGVGIDPFVLGRILILGGLWAFPKALR